MRISIRMKAGCFLLCVALGVGAAGCGKSKDGADSQTDPMSGIDTLPNTNAGGETGTNQPGTTTQPGTTSQPGTTPQPTGPANLDQLPKCTQCANAHCVPANLVPAAQQGLLSRCQDQGSFCVPDSLLQNPAGFVLPSCRSIANVEGRCLSTCLPLVTAELSRLPQGNCKADERCVPCYHPITGEDTQVCRQGGDPGPQEPPQSFPDCCQGGGACVPATLVPQAQRGFLQQGECPSADQLCAPKDLTRSDYKPPKCKSIGGANGRCLSLCIPGLSALSSLLPKDTCAANYLCVPCADPITSTDTGACRINGDTP